MVDATFFSNEFCVSKLGHIVVFLFLHILVRSSRVLE